MIGRILFAWKYGTSLDHNAKTWRLVAGNVKETKQKKEEKEERILRRGVREGMIERSRKKENKKRRK